MEAGKSKIKELARLCSGESPLPGSQLVASHSVLTWWKELGGRVLWAGGSLFYNNTNPFHGGSTFMT